MDDVKYSITSSSEDAGPCNVVGTLVSPCLHNSHPKDAAIVKIYRPYIKAQNSKGKARKRTSAGRGMKITEMTSGERAYCTAENNPIGLPDLDPPFKNERGAIAGVCAPHVDVPNNKAGVINTTKNCWVSVKRLKLDKSLFSPLLQSPATLTKESSAIPPATTNISTKPAARRKKVIQDNGSKINCKVLGRRSGTGSSIKSPKRKEGFLPSSLRRLIPHNNAGASEQHNQDWDLSNPHPSRIAAASSPSKPLCNSNGCATDITTTKKEATKIEILHEADLKRENVANSFSPPPPNLQKRVQRDISTTSKYAPTLIFPRPRKGEAAKLDQTFLDNDTNYLMHLQFANAQVKLQRIHIKQDVLKDKNDVVMRKGACQGKQEDEDSPLRSSDGVTKMVKISLLTKPMLPNHEKQQSYLVMTAMQPSEADAKETARIKRETTDAKKRDAKQMEQPEVVNAIPPKIPRRAQLIVEKLNIRSNGRTNGVIKVSEGCVPKDVVIDRLPCPQFLNIKYLDQVEENIIRDLSELRKKQKQFFALNTALEDYPYDAYLLGVRNDDWVHKDVDTKDNHFFKATMTVVENGVSHHTRSTDEVYEMLDHESITIECLSEGASESGHEPYDDNVNSKSASRFSNDEEHCQTISLKDFKKFNPMLNLDGLQTINLGQKIARVEQ